jgi:CTP:molybdopterin cytidylyltransferase MocA
VSDSSAHAAVVLLADMPFVTTAMILTLIAKYRQGAAPLVISDYDGVNAPRFSSDGRRVPVSQHISGVH